MFKVPEIRINSCGAVPIDELKQRLIYALNAKIEKYQKYIKDNPSLANNVLIIAINTSCLSNYGKFMDCTEPLILEACKDISIFEKYPFITGVIYNHKSIFEYNLQFKVIFINKDYSILEDEI